MFSSMIYTHIVKEVFVFLRITMTTLNHLDLHIFWTLLNALTPTTAQPSIDDIYAAET